MVGEVGNRPNLSKIQLERMVGKDQRDQNTVVRNFCLVLPDYREKNNGVRCPATIMDLKTKVIILVIAG